MSRELGQMTSTLTKNVSSIVSVAPIIRSSSHVWSHVKQANLTNMYNALAGSAFRIVGGKLVIRESKISGSDVGEYASIVM